MALSRSLRIPTFYLAPTGDDRATGDRSDPWQTLAGGREAARRFRREQGWAGRIDLVLLPGEYALTEPLDLTSQDSHMWLRAATPGTAVISGGRRVSGWQVDVQNGRRVWRCHLLEYARREPFRSLWVNGERRPRARWPKFALNAEGISAVRRLGEIRQDNSSPLQPGDHRFKLRAEDDGRWPSLPEAEFVILHYWCDDRLPHPMRDRQGDWISCARRSSLRLLESWGPEPARYYVDNLGEALTEEGEWYFDRAESMLSYLPLPDETPEHVEVVIPWLHTLVRVDGEDFIAKKDASGPACPLVAEDVVFEGLTFAHSDWQQPAPLQLAHDRIDPGGVPAAGSPQAASSVPGAVALRHARNCTFSRCTFRQLGHYALEIGRGCWDMTVRGCTFWDLGAGGVKIDGCDLDGPLTARTGRVEVTDNTIHRIGRVFHQGVGVLITSAQACVVRHNHIHDTLYTGISVGWSWGYRSTVSRDHLIADNHLHDIGQGLLSDMGAIYVLGVQPGTVIRHNRIHDVRAHNYGAWGIYLDEGCSHVVVEQNLVHDTQGACLNIHYGRENVVRNNVFVRGGEALVCLGKVEQHVAACLRGNVFVGPTRQIYIGGYEGDVTASGRGLESDANLIGPKISTQHFGGDPAYRAPGATVSCSLAQWRASGRDRASRQRPSLLRESGSWQFAGDQKLGIPPVDWGGCGRRILDAPAENSA